MYLYNILPLVYLINLTIKVLYFIKNMKNIRNKCIYIYTHNNTRVYYYLLPLNYPTYLISTPQDNCLKLIFLIYSSKEI